MRPWMHKSKLAPLIDSQRALARVRTPATPSLSGVPPQQPAAEELDALNKMAAGLHTLRLQLASYPDLVEHVDELMEYVQQTQQEFPPPGQNEAFDRLLHLRSMIFWLPASLLSAESDLGALAMLSHFFAIALVLEPLFPEIAGAYLGNLSLDPLEQVCHIVQARSAAMPHDLSLRTAVSMMELPMQVAHAYRVSHQGLSNPVSPFRQLSQPGHYILPNASLPLAQDGFRHGPYTSLQSPIGVLHSPTYMSSYQNSSVHRHDSVVSRAHSDSRMSTTPSIHGLVSPQSSAESASTSVDYFMGASSYTSPYGAGNDYQSRFVQAKPPPPIWT